MELIQQELDKISLLLREKAIDSEEYNRLYIAQQALSWVIDPLMFQSPCDVIVGTLANSVNYSIHSHLVAS